MLHVAHQSSTRRHDLDLYPLRRDRARWLAGCALVTSLATVSAQSEEPAAQFWRYGKWPDHLPVTSRLPGGDQVPATHVPCGGCHGAGGTGQREGGVDAPPVAGASLTTPRQIGAGVRPAYDFKTFGRAIRDGHDSRGVELGPAMPRYALDDAQLLALWQFLLAGAHVPAPGFAAHEVRLGVWPAPADPWAAAVAHAITPGQLSASIHGRVVRIVPLTVGNAADVKHLQESDQAIAALLAPSGALDPQIVAAFAATGALIVAPDPCLGGADLPAVLRLSPSAAQQAASLRSRSPGHAALAVAGAEGARCRAAVQPHLAALSTPMVRLGAVMSLKLLLMAPRPGQWLALVAPESAVAATSPLCRHGAVSVTVAPLVDAALAAEPLTRRSLSAWQPSTQGRLHAKAAFALVQQWLQQVGRAAPDVALWTQLPRSGRPWDSGVSARLSWGPRSTSALDEVWLAPLCGRLAARAWRPQREDYPK